MYPIGFNSDSLITFTEKLVLSSSIKNKNSCLPLIPFSEGWKKIPLADARSPNHYWAIAVSSLLCQILQHVINSNIISFSEWNLFFKFSLKWSPEILLLRKAVSLTHRKRSTCSGSGASSLAVFFSCFLKHVRHDVPRTANPKTNQHKSQLQCANMPKMLFLPITHNLFEWSEITPPYLPLTWHAPSFVVPSP